MWSYTNLKIFSYFVEFFFRDEFGLKSNNSTIIQLTNANHTLGNLTAFLSKEN